LAAGAQELRFALAEKDDDPPRRASSVERDGGASRGHPQARNAIAHGLPQARGCRPTYNRARPSREQQMQPGRRRGPTVVVVVVLDERIRVQQRLRER